MRAASIAQLEKDVAYFPKQYSTLLGERGITLSGGQKARLALAKLLYDAPNFLILDEPFTGFDPINAELVKNELLELKSKGTTIILSTHILPEVSMTCNRVVNNGDPVYVWVSTDLQVFHNSIVANLYDVGWDSRWSTATWC